MFPQVGGLLACVTDRLPANAPLAQVARRIREMVKAGREVVFSSHALDEMRADKLTIDDVRTVLSGCAVVERQGAPKFRAEGGTVDGERVAVVLRIFEDETDLFIITVWKIDKVTR